VKFTELDLHPKLQANLEKIGFSETTPIQEQSIPILLQGRDVAGLAQTGTGKTAAFLLPLLDRMLRSIESVSSETKHPRDFGDWKKRNCLLVLVPTRELADQVYENALTLIPDTGLSAVSIYGGTTYEKQKAALSEGVEIVIATPGRLIDLYKEHHFDMGQVRAVVFDEADRMFDMGFKDDMKFILRRLPRTRQFLVFSATLNFDVLNVAYEFGADPVEINISRDQAKAEHVKDTIFHVGTYDKPSYLISVFKRENPKQTIIFSNFKRNVERITMFLNKNGHPAMGISSLLTQAQRTRMMAQFKEDNDHNILVATDLAARGLDIKGVDMVINYELPDDPENYVHRIGRTGRAGKEGFAISLVSDRDVDALARIESFLKHKIEAGWMDDANLIKDFVAFPTDEQANGPSTRPQRPKRDFDKRGGGGSGPRDGRRPSGPPRSGNRDRNDRGPRPERTQEARQGGEQKRHPQRPQGDRPQPEKRNDRPQQAAHSEKSGGSAHRDRRTGRHGNQPQAKSDQPRRPQQGQGPQNPLQRRPLNPNGNGNRKQHSSSRTRGGQPAAKPATAGIGGKVTGLIKKLFGRKPAKSPNRSS
jgi:superfamily II DNA/RNA helicase